MSDREYVEAAVRRFRHDLAALVTAYARQDVDIRDVLGDPVEFAIKSVLATAPVPSPWDDLAGPFIRSSGVQARLGITRQAVAGRARRRRLLRVITAGGVHLYPLWQFSGHDVVPGLPEVLVQFPEPEVDGWTLAGWLRRSEPELGASPLEALTGGERAKVLAVARMAARSVSA